MEILTNYRLAGNCFATCITQACLYLNDPRLNVKKPELQIFDELTLLDKDPSKELAQALSYLINNNYSVEIYDPEPYSNGNWGEHVKNRQSPKNLYLEISNPDEKKLIELQQRKFFVVLSTIDDIVNIKSPHGVLVLPNGKIKDPQNSEYWAEAQDTLVNYINRTDNRFLLAFNKNQ